MSELGRNPQTADLGRGNSAETGKCERRLCRETSGMLQSLSTQRMQEKVPHGRSPQKPVDREGEQRLFDDIGHQQAGYCGRGDRVGIERPVNQENLIAQLKVVHALRHRNLESNWAYMVMASLAWNLKSRFGLSLRWASIEKRAVIEIVNAFIASRQGRKTIYRLLAWNPWRFFFAASNDAYQC